MPFYVYHCPDCGAEFEVLRPASQRDDAQACDQCGSQRPTRSAASFATARGGSRDGSSAPSCGRGGFT